jgi:hypothetical protein
MTNAKTELLEHLVNKPKVKCAKLRTGYGWDEEGQTLYLLKCNYTNEDWETFLKSIDFNYDSGYGGQELFGTLWLEDGTWLERGEYDGSEWWEYKKTPEIPDQII